MSVALLSSIRLDFLSHKIQVQVKNSSLWTLHINTLTAGSHIVRPLTMRIAIFAIMRFWGLDIEICIGSAYCLGTYMILTTA